MSELINNSEKRKELLKHMILQLHAGEAPDMVRARLVEILAKIPYDEVVEVEQQLINEGLPAEEVLQFCDIHTMVLDGHIDQSHAKTIPAGHPVGEIMQKIAEMKSEEIIEIITPFLPSPMIAKVKDAGCETFTKEENGLFYNYFIKR